MCESKERQVSCQAEPCVGSSAPVCAFWATVREGAGKTGIEVPNGRASVCTHVVVLLAMRRDL